MDPVPISGTVGSPTAKIDISSKREFVTFAVLILPCSWNLQLFRLFLIPMSKGKGRSSNMRKSVSLCMAFGRSFAAVAVVGTPF